MVNQDTLEILIRARRIIAKPEQWTQCVFARKADGRSCRLESEEAVQFCLVGALFRSDAAVDLTDVEAVVLIGRPFNSVAKLNDASTHVEVIEAIDAAILHLSPCQDRQDRSRAHAASAAASRSAA